MNIVRMSRTATLVEREGCTTQLKIVIEGAESKEFRKRKAALQALDRLYENSHVSALAYVATDFAQSHDTFKQFLAKKAREYLQK